MISWVSAFSPLLILASLWVAAEQQTFLEWSLEKAVQVLNESPWARTESLTRVVGGVGSGVSGEKEIFYTFYVRLLSARPIREAYTRVQLIQLGYDELPPEDQAQFSGLIEERVAIDFSRFIVVAVAFRCNDPNEESRIRQYFESQTTGTMKNSAFLSTAKFSQVPLIGYYPARESGVGARFVFPRFVDDEPLVATDDRQITFEFTALPVSPSQSGGGGGGRGGGGGGGGPGGGGGGRGGGRGGDAQNDSNNENNGILRTSFDVRAMIADGKLEF